MVDIDKNRVPYANPNLRAQKAAIEGQDVVRATHL